MGYIQLKKRGYGKGVGTTAGHKSGKEGGEQTGGWVASFFTCDDTDAGTAGLMCYIDQP